MTTFAEILVLNQIIVEKQNREKVIEIYQFAQKKYPQNRHGLYVSEDEILEITSARQLSECFSVSLLFSLEEKIKPFMLSDFRQQLLILKEVVKPSEFELPSASFLQLRHIEVPLKVYDEYDVWRKKTIFEYVKQNGKVDFFSAYHSFFSTEPGVTFLSGFNCDTSTYLNSFSTSEYQKIVQEAGSKYICGGEKSLYTKIYQKV